MPDLTWPKDLTAIIQSIFAVVAIAGGAAFAIFKLQLFREFAPHISVTHEVSYRRIGNSYTHIDLTATLHNSSRVKVEVSSGEFRLLEIAPVLDDHELEERLAERDSIGSNEPFGHWPVIDHFRFEWGDYDLLVEPGQTFSETIEFVIHQEITTIAIQSYFFNSDYLAGSRKPEGWGAVNVYDIVVS